MKSIARNLDPSTVTDKTLRIDSYSGVGNSGLSFLSEQLYFTSLYPTAMWLQHNWSITGAEGFYKKWRVILYHTVFAWGFVNTNVATHLSLSLTVDHNFPFTLLNRPRAVWYRLYGPRSRVSTTLTPWIDGSGWIQTRYLTDKKSESQQWAIYP